MSALGLVILILAIAANYGPLHSYLDAKARLQKANAGIAELSAQKAELQTELGRLSQADYLESLARQELAYARPGEELYIVTGLEGGLDPTQGAGAGAGQQGGGGDQDVVTGGDGAPGFLERVLGPTIE